MRPDSSDPRLATRFPRCSLGINVQVLGLDTIQIGPGSAVGDDSWLNDCIRDGTPRLRIGERVLIGRRAVLSTAGELEIGDFCVLAPDVYVADSDHVYSDPLQPILQQGVTVGRKIVVEENCWFGIGAKAFGELTVGRGSVIAAGSIVRRDVEPFVMVGGNPAVPRKFYCFGRREWLPYDKTSFTESRNSSPPPSRSAYQAILRENSILSDLGRDVAGGGICI